MNSHTHPYALPLPLLSCRGYQVHMKSTTGAPIQVEVMNFKAGMEQPVVVDRIEPAGAAIAVKQEEKPDQSRPAVAASAASAEPVPSASAFELTGATDDMERALERKEINEEYLNLMQYIHTDTSSELETPPGLASITDDLLSSGAAWGSV